MPFKSEAQRRWMYAKHSAMARRWSSHTPRGAKLPDKVSAAMSSMGLVRNVEIFVRRREEAERLRRELRHVSRGEFDVDDVSIKPMNGPVSIPTKSRNKGRAHAGNRKVSARYEEPLGFFLVIPGPLTKEHEQYIRAFVKRQRGFEASHGKPHGVGMASHEQHLHAVNNYIFTSRKINKMLRGVIPPTPITVAARNRLDSLFRVAYPVKRDIVVYRGSKQRSFRVGDVITDNAFLSTSLSKHAAENFAEGHGGVAIKIIVPAGTSVLRLDRASFAKHYNEREILLPRGSTYKIVAEDPHTIWYTAVMVKSGAMSFGLSENPIPPHPGLSREASVKVAKRFARTFNGDGHKPRGKNGMVSVDALRSFQRAVSNHTVRKYVNQTESPDRVSILVHHGHPVVIDGNHRVVAAMKNGMDLIPAQFFEWSRDVGGLVPYSGDTRQFSRL